MNSALAGSLGLSALFLALAHSCLHYFLSIERKQTALPLVAALLPWPVRGRVVALLALSAALVFFCAAMRIGFTPDSSDGAVLVLVILVSPLLAHIGWLVCCMKRAGSGWAFVPAQPSARASSFIVGLPALVAGVTYFIRQLI
jgi:hypothetical protein